MFTAFDDLPIQQAFNIPVAGNILSCNNPLSTGICYTSYFCIAYTSKIDSVFILY